MRSIAVAAFALLIAAPALAQEPTIELKKAPGLDKVETNCAVCHSLDYIQMNSPFPNAALWDAEVTKMIKVYGAPISDADAAVIADYLKQQLRQLSPGSVVSLLHLRPCAQARQITFVLKLEPVRRRLPACPRDRAPERIRS